MPSTSRNGRSYTLKAMGSRRHCSVASRESEQASARRCSALHARAAHCHTRGMSSSTTTSICTVLAKLQHNVHDCSCAWVLACPMHVQSSMIIHMHCNTCLLPISVSRSSMRLGVAFSSVGFQQQADGLLVLCLWLLERNEVISNLQQQCHTQQHGGST